MIKFNIFGSKSSKDYDVLVFTNALGTIDENHATVKKNNETIRQLFLDKGWPVKEINSNLGVLDENGMLSKVFKGTPDEVNNSCYYTYDRHEQMHPLAIKSAIVRTEFYTDLKLKRCFRFIISFYSRIPEWRSSIKEAMRGTFDQRIECVKKIDFRIHTEFPGKKELKEDIYKVLAFQLAQTILLCEHGLEIYSKEEVLEYFEYLENFINRKEISKNDLDYLDCLKNDLIELAEIKIKTMTSLKEEIL